MTTYSTRAMRLAACLTLPLSVWAQTPATTGTPATALLAISSTPSEVAVSPESATAPTSVAAPEGCRSLTDKAMAADMKAVTAQSQKIELPEQARLFEGAEALWMQAVAQCEGRAKDRAQRNLADSQKVRASISEQQDAGPQCAAAHKDAAALQDIARQALGERRWSDASMLFRKAENMWDMASERCTGSQQEVANRRRDQSEIDGQNAEFCAPLFEKARESTQKFRTAATGMSREDKQDASMVAETLWRDAVSQCKGAAVQDSARNNAQALARERGTPWVARIAPATQLASNAAKAGTATGTVSGGVMANLSSVAASLGNALKPAAVAANPEVSPTTPAVELAETSSDSTRFSGQFVRDTDGPTYSGNGKVTWASGDVYEGTLVKGKRQGKGLFVWANGQRYDGDWIQDKPTGQARVQFANGNQFEGSTLEGIPQGQGHMRYASGDSYTGTFEAGEPQGRGLYIWKSGQQFDGTWKNTRPNGQGKLKFATGNQYEGMVLEGVPHGQGHMLFATGATYTGNFVNGQPDGLGTFNWPSGEQYTGQWKAGQKHGRGTFTWKSGDLWEGLYENDQQVNDTPVASKK